MDDELVPLGVVDERDSFGARRPWSRTGPVRPHPADVGGGRSGREGLGVSRSLAAEVEEMGALAGGEHALDPRVRGQPEGGAMLAGLRTL